MGLPGEWTIAGELELADRFQCPQDLRSALKSGRGKIDPPHSRKGTFKADSLNSRQKIIYHLIPCADYTLRADMNGRSTIDMIQAGLLRAYAGMDCRVVSLPFTRNNILTDFYYESLNMIEPGAKVFVSGMWYRYGFKFLVERGCDVVLYTQNFSSIPDDDNYTPYIQAASSPADTASVSAAGAGINARLQEADLCASYLKDVTNHETAGFLRRAGFILDMPQNLGEFRGVVQELWESIAKRIDGLLLGNCILSSPITATVWPQSRAADDTRLLP